MNTSITISIETNDINYFTLDNFYDSCWTTAIYMY